MRYAAGAIQRAAADEAADTLDVRYFDTPRRCRYAARHTLLRPLRMSTLLLRYAPMSMPPCHAARYACAVTRLIRYAVCRRHAMLPRRSAAEDA